MITPILGTFGHKSGDIVTPEGAVIESFSLDFPLYNTNNALSYGTFLGQRKIVYPPLVTTGSEEMCYLNLESRAFSYPPYYGGAGIGPFTSGQAPSGKGLVLGCQSGGGDASAIFAPGIFGGSVSGGQFGIAAYPYYITENTYEGYTPKLSAGAFIPAYSSPGLIVYVDLQAKEILLFNGPDNLLEGGADSFGDGYDQTRSLESDIPYYVYGIDYYLTVGCEQYEGGVVAANGFAYFFPMWSSGVSGVPRFSVFYDESSGSAGAVQLGNWNSVLGWSTAIYDPVSNKIFAFPTNNDWGGSEFPIVYFTPGAYGLGVYDYTWFAVSEDAISSVLAPNGKIYVNTTNHIVEFDPATFTQVVLDYPEEFLPYVTYRTNLLLDGYDGSIYAVGSPLYFGSCRLLQISNVSTPNILGTDAILPFTSGNSFAGSNYNSQQNHF